MPAPRREREPAIPPDLADLQMLTVNEVAAICDVHQMTIRRMVERGEIRHVKIGGSVRIPVAAVRELLKDVL